MTMVDGKSFSIGEIIGTILAIILIGIGFYLVFMLVSDGIKDYKNYSEYKEFCSTRNDFCYCDMDVALSKCIFKTQWSSVNGFTNDTIELCKLANKLKDKEVLFEVGCND